MNVKEIWTEADFEEMKWHDSYIYAISFPNNNLEFSLDIDYLPGARSVLDNTPRVIDIHSGPVRPGSPHVTIHPR